MVDAHVPQQFSTLRATCRREDLRACGAGDRDRGLPDPPGRGVDQHPVTGGDSGQVVQPVPGGGVRGGYGSGQSSVKPAAASRHVGIAGNKRGPAAVLGEAADTVADVVLGDVGPDRGRHASEIDTQLW